MDRDLLFGVMAVQLGQATAQQVMAAAAAHLMDASKPVPERLLADGVLSEERFRMVSSLVDEALRAHGGDPKRAVETLGGQRAVLQSFGGSIVLNEAGAAEPSPKSSPSDGAGGAEDLSAVTPEAVGRYSASGDAEIGRGGIGRVLVAYDGHLGREIAVKELLEGASGSSAGTPRSNGLSRKSAAVARFLREARVTGQLEHPNIVPVYEVGQRDDLTFYYTMKLVRGRTLASALGQCRSLGDRVKLLRHYIDLCNAVAYAHSRGVIHRDIKTENVMLGEFGETVVLDWGLAKVRGKTDIRSREIARELALFQDANAGQTVDGATMGTPAYMSPEQADGKVDEIDERSDVWSLGAVLYEVLTGKPPFEGVTPFEVIGKVLKDPVVPPRSFDPAIPAELEAVALKALSRDRNGRYQRAGELAAEIEAFTSGGRIGAYEYGSLELLRRFVAKNRAATGLAAVIFVLIASSSAVLYRAYKQAEAGRAATEVARQVAEDQKRIAATRLAEAYLGEARRLVAARNFTAAYVYAAATLREYQRLGGVPEEQRVALDSALYTARVRRSLELERTLPGPAEDPAAIAMSADGRLLAVIDAKQSVSLYTLDGSRPPQTTVTGGYPVSLAFAPGGAQLLVGEWEGLRTLSTNNLEKVAFEPIGTVWLIHPHDPNRVVVYDKGICRLIFRNGSHQPVLLGPITAAAWSADGSLLARGDATGSVAIHDATTGELTLSLKAGSRPVGGCAFSADARKLLVAFDTEKVIVVIARKTVLTLPSHGLVARYTFPPSPVGSGWILGGRDGAVLWDGVTADEKEVLWRSDSPTFTEVARDRQHVVLVQRGVVRLWKVRGAERAVEIPSDSQPIELAYSPDVGRVAFATADGAVLPADTAGSEPAVRIAEHATGFLTTVSFSPDGSRIASVGDEQIVKVYDTRTHSEVAARQLTHLKWGNNQGSSARYSADGRLIAVTAPTDCVFLLDADTLEVQRVIPSGVPWARALRFSQDGSRLLVGGAWGGLSWWDTATWRLQRLVAYQEMGETSDVTATRDGKDVLTAGVDGWVRRISLETGERRGSSHAHDAWVNELSLSSDGVLLATASDDHTVKLWTASDLAPVRTLGLDTQVGALMFSPAGGTFALGDLRGLIVFPDLRSVLDTDGSALFEQVSREAGLGLEGFALAPCGEPKHAGDATAAAPPAAEPDGVRGRVGYLLFPSKGMPYGTKVELVDEESHEPITPPLIATPAADKSISFKLPTSVQRFAARISAGGETNYISSPSYRRGASETWFRIITRADAASLAEAVGVKVVPGAGHVWGTLYWGSRNDVQQRAAVGCAVVTEDSGARAYYASPSPLSRVHPDVRMDAVHPGAAYFYLFNLTPGKHQLTVRVGDSSVEADVLVHEGMVTQRYVLFPNDLFPDNPTPPLCMADWAPADKKK